MQVIVPIASDDPAFSAAGYEKPRPLIEVSDRPIIQWATDCVMEVVDESDLIFPVLQSHIASDSIHTELERIYSDEITIVPLNGMTEGPAETVLEAEDSISAEELIVLFGDQYLDLPLADQLASTTSDGLVPVFSSSDPEWSYARTDSDGRIEEIAEKEVISQKAIPGLHYFARGTDFVRGARQMIEKDIRTHNVYKISPVYNELIELGREIEISPVTEMWSLGTPTDVETFATEFEGET